MEYQKRFLDTEILKKRLVEMGHLGLKSVMFAGEGEPFLHKDIADIIKTTRQTAGIDIGVTSNGVLLKESLVNEILGLVDWIKISINGATPETYAKIHRCKPADLDLVIRNMTYANKIRRDNKYKSVLGMQLLLLPDNQHEVVPLAKLAKEIGMDYLVIKPYSQHPQSRTHQYENIKYCDFALLAEELAQLKSSSFSVIFRMNAMQTWNESSRDYQHCLALPFWSYLDAGGNIWGCSMYMGDDRFLYGNIYESSFQEIWEGEKRRKSLQLVEKELDATICRINCRMDKINKYLWELKNLPEHVNFI
jgi:radical SAM protein with 4Fe4S-binding SPASM domain